MTKFVKILILTTILSLGVYGIAQAFFTDTEESYANPVQASTINLQVGDSDPSVYSFSFPNVFPGQTFETETNIANTSNLPGNFWIEIGGSNSQEGENPEGETDTEGEGELIDCADVRLSFVDDVGQEVVVFDSMPLTSYLRTYDYAEVNSAVDEMVNMSTAKMKVQMRIDNCGKESMADSFDIDMVFHLDQV